ncbi:hypothetical protein AVEN_10036-1 [Araneus ventricosus]|uniref:Uncharacterized protein n=1 Tax=Araneus ventricosus TaxID=182803 RepID=A0A4Y2T4X0_ARAVE|nr:hypothetical protein AVEN_10036-1 [Araneus ventricosus]
MPTSDRFFLFRRWGIKPRSHDQITHRFRPRLAFFPVVGTKRFYGARGFVSASVVSRVVAVNSSDNKGRQCIRSLERCREICQAMRRWNGVTGRNSPDHSPQMRTSSDSKFGQVTRYWNKLNANCGRNSWKDRP